MTIALISLISLFIAIGLSQVSHLNIGVVALCFAWIVGYGLGGLSIKELIAGFPISLFIVLFGITLLFGQAQQNGTLGRLAGFSMRLAHGQPALLPLIFFVLALILWLLRM